MTRTIASEVSADRIAIREPIDGYAHCADRRDADGQIALFTRDTAFHVFMDSRSPEPKYVLNGRDALAPVFADLNQYQATTHFNGQSTIHLDGASATGETYCIAHHVTVAGDKRTLMIASIRYLDKFVKRDGSSLSVSSWSMDRNARLGSLGSAPLVSPKFDPRIPNAGIERQGANGILLDQHIGRFAADAEALYSFGARGR
jgi:hypothetical protein